MVFILLGIPICNTSLESLCIQLAKMASFGRFALVAHNNLRLNALTLQGFLFFLRTALVNIKF